MKRRFAAASLALVAVAGLSVATASPSSADDCFRVGNFWVCPA